MIDYNLIDRITAIKLELEYETDNTYSILIAIRNILHQSDGLSYLQIKNILIHYFNIYPNENVNYNVINLITNPISANNNFMLSILLNNFNENDTQSNSEELESLNSTDDSSNEIIEETSYDPNFFLGQNNFHQSNNNINYLLNLFNLSGNGINSFAGNNINPFSNFPIHPTRPRMALNRLR